MRHIESMADKMNGVATFELPSGKRHCVDARMARELGMAGLLRMAGEDVPTERVPLFQRGEQIGSMAPTFDPIFIRSTNWLYEPRSGDFRRTEVGWIASDKLGPGDLEAVPGFVWDRRDSD